MVWEYIPLILKFFFFTDKSHTFSMAKTIAFQTTKTITSGIGKELQRYGMRLSDIHYVSPSELRANPVNSRLFKEESSGYFHRLRKDIQEKGILNPLLATSGGKLLAGHNRLRIAEELDLPSVPVQYVEETLSEEREKEIIIKDNLLRRQFSSSEWVMLYKQLYPNFDEEITKENRGGDRKSKNETTSNDDNNADTVQTPTKLTAKRIAQETGQTENAVKKHLRTYKQQLTPKRGAATISTSAKVSTKASAKVIITPKEAAQTIDAILLQASVSEEVRKKIRGIVSAISA